MRHSLTTVAFLMSLAPASLWAEAPEIRHVEVTKPDMGWKFVVTLKHPDTGWTHYADGWEILDLDGNRIRLRALTHPHVTEQPFTRSLRNVMIPDGTRAVLLRAHCSVDGWSSKAVKVKLSPQGNGRY